MAFLINNEEEQNQALGGAPLAQSGQSGVVGSGLSGPHKPTQSGQFTNLNDYLRANMGNDGSSISSAINKEAENQFNIANQAIPGQIQWNWNDQVKTAQNTPQDTMAYQNAQNYYKNAIGSLGSESGRTALLGGILPGRNAGVNTLDQALYQGAGEPQKNIDFMNTQLNRLRDVNTSFNPVVDESKKTTPGMNEGGGPWNKQRPEMDQFNLWKKNHPGFKGF